MKKDQQSKVTHTTNGESIEYDWITGEWIEIDI